MSHKIENLTGIRSLRRFFELRSPEGVERLDQRLDLWQLLNSIKKIQAGHMEHLADLPLEDQLQSQLQLKYETISRAVFNVDYRRTNSNAGERAQAREFKRLLIDYATKIYDGLIPQDYHQQKALDKHYGPDKYQERLRQFFTHLTELLELDTNTVVIAYEKNKDKARGSVAYDASLSGKMEDTERSQKLLILLGALSLPEVRYIIESMGFEVDDPFWSKIIRMLYGRKAVYLLNTHQEHARFGKLRYLAHRATPHRGKRKNDHSEDFEYEQAIVNLEQHSADESNAGIIDEDAHDSNQSSR